MSSIRFESLFSQQVIKEAYFKNRKPESEEPEKPRKNKTQPHRGRRLGFV